MKKAAGLTAVSFILIITAAFAYYNKNTKWELACKITDKIEKTEFCYPKYLGEEKEVDLSVNHLGVILKAENKNFRKARKSAFSNANNALRIDDNNIININEDNTALLGTAVIHSEDDLITDMIEGSEMKIRLYDANKNQFETFIIDLNGFGRVWKEFTEKWDPTVR